MRIHVLRLVLFVFFPAFLSGCDRETGPKWTYHCEAEDGVMAPTACHIQLIDKNHILRLVQSNGIWGMQASSGKAGHVRAELTFSPGRGEPIVITAARKTGSCSSRRCTLVLTNEELAALLKTKQFNLVVKRAEIEPHNIRHLESNEVFPTRGLKDAMEAAEA